MFTFEAAENLHHEFVEFYLTGTPTAALCQGGAVLPYTTLPNTLASGSCCRTMRSRSRPGQRVALAAEMLGGALIPLVIGRAIDAFTPSAIPVGATVCVLTAAPCRAGSGGPPGRPASSLRR